MHLLEMFCGLFAVLLGFGLLTLLLVALGTLALRVVHSRRVAILRISHRSGLMLASAFLSFQRIVHPHVRHAIVQRAEGEDAAADDCGSLQQSLRRIRRGGDPGELLVEPAPQPPHRFSSSS